MGDQTGYELGGKKPDEEPDDDRLEEELDDDRLEIIPIGGDTTLTLDGAIPTHGKNTQPTSTPPTSSSAKKPLPPIDPANTSGSSSTPPYSSPSTTPSGIASAPRNLNPVTMTRASQMGYKNRFWFWRTAAMNPGWLKLQLSSIEKKIEILNHRDFKKDDLIAARTIIDQKIKNNELDFDDLKASINSVKPELFEKVIAPAIRGQFARGIPKDIREFPHAVTSLNDINLSQRLDPNMEYAAYEILHVLDEAIYYQDVKLKTESDGTFAIVKVDPNDATKTNPLVTGTPAYDSDENKNMVKYELHSHSVEGVRALSDMIAQLRQGNNNAVTITETGDPIEALNFMYQVIVVNNMHVIISEPVVEQLLQDIEDLKNDPNNNVNVDELKKLADILLANKDTFDYKDHRRLFKSLTVKENLKLLSGTKKGITASAVRDDLIKDTNQYLGILNTLAGSNLPPPSQTITPPSNTPTPPTP